MKILKYDNGYGYGYDTIKDSKTNETEDCQNKMAVRVKNGIVGRLIYGCERTYKGHGESYYARDIKFNNSKTLKLEKIEDGELFVLIEEDYYDI